MFRKAFVDLEKETLKNNGTGLSGTRRILPKEVYELEEEDEAERKTKGWLSWFRGIYGQDDQTDETKPAPSIGSPEVSPQSKSSEEKSRANDSKATNILSKILPTAHKNHSATDTQQVQASPDNTTSGTDSPPKQSGSKS